jgi:hypothetical protein
MSPTVLFALCILASDFLLYALFRWTYPDRRKLFSRRRFSRSRVLTGLSMPNSMRQR